MNISKHLQTYNQSNIHYVWRCLDIFILIPIRKQPFIMSNMHYVQDHEYISPAGPRRFAQRLCAEISWVAGGIRCQGLPGLPFRLGNQRVFVDDMYIYIYIHINHIFTFMIIYMYISIYLSIYLSVYRSIYLSSYLSGQIIATLLQLHWNHGYQRKHRKWLYSEIICPCLYTIDLDIHMYVYMWMIFEYSYIRL